MPNNKKKIQGGFILYPRKYTINKEDPDKSFVEGVTQSGHEVVVYLNPDLKAREAAEKDKDKNIPSLKRFGDKDPRARNICWASEDNCADKPQGVLLVEQISKREQGNHATPVWEAKWASIVREIDHTPKPEVGLGYLEINYHHKPDDETAMNMEAYTRLLEDIKTGAIDNPIEADQKKQELYDKITISRRKWFVGVIVKYEETINVTDPKTITKESLHAALKEPLEKYTKDGTYGGALIRVKRGDKVLAKLCSDIEMRYDFENGCVKPFDDTFDYFWDRFSKYTLNKLTRDPSLSLDVIPVLRVNSGPKSNAKYAKELANPELLQFGPLPTPKIMKAYVDSKFHNDPFASFKFSKAFLASRVVIRVAMAKEGAGEGNKLLSTIHSYSPVVGNAFEIDAEGKKQFEIDFESYR